MAQLDALMHAVTAMVKGQGKSKKDEKDDGGAAKPGQARKAS